MKFRQAFPLFVSYISAFVLGGYTYSSLHNHPVELHKWIITGFFGVFFLVLHRKELKK